MGIENPVHLLFIAVIALVVLGPRRLPELAKALGNGIREFRESVGQGAAAPLEPPAQAPPHPIVALGEDAPAPSLAAPGPAPAAAPGTLTAESPEAPAAEAGTSAGDGTAPRGRLGAPRPKDKEPPKMTPEETAVATEPVLVERRGNVLLITLNRPEVRNAVNAALAAAVAGALEQLDEDDGLSIGVLTGAGGYFSAGMDLGAFVKGESPWFGDRGFGGIAQRASRKPLIAAIEGFAVAGGMEIALACDLIVAAKGAKMGIPESKRSIVAAGGALLRLPKRMPYHLVMELALTGDPFPAERFHELGLVNRLAEPGSAVEVALELAAKIAANGPLALMASKQILQEQFDWSSAEMWEKQLEISGPVLASEDAKEGAAAFKEKREPVWRGR